MSHFYDEITTALPELKVLKDEPMRRHTTFRIGGPADYFVYLFCQKYIIRGVLAGAVTGGKLLRCEAVDSSAAYSTDSSGTGYVGGLAGLVDGGTITGCIARNVTATLGYNNTAGSVGGLVGFMKNNSTTININFFRIQS